MVRRHVALLFLFGLIAIFALPAAADDANAIAIVPEPDIEVPEGFDPYAVLGVPGDASRAEIRKAHKAAVKGVSERNSEALEALELAFSILGSADKKARWDERTGRKPAGGEGAADL